MSKLTTLADAIASALKSLTLPAGTTVTRDYLVNLELPSDAPLGITVMPWADHAKPAGMAVRERSYRIPVVLSQIVTAATAEYLDPLLGVCETISAFLLDTGIPGYECASVARDPAYDPEALRQRRQFLATLDTEWIAIDG